MLYAHGLLPTAIRKEPTALRKFLVLYAPGSLPTYIRDKPTALRRCTVSIKNYFKTWIEFDADGIGSEVLAAVAVGGVAWADRFSNRGLHARA